MGEEDQPRHHAEDQRPDIADPVPHRPPLGGKFRRSLVAVDQLLAPLALFVLAYVATLLLLGWAVPAAGQWQWTAAAALATWTTVALWEGGRWNVGFFVAPRRAVSGFLSGAALGALLVGSAAAAIVLTSRLHHVRGEGFPWSDLAAVYLPAALHEELVFRGYPFQKLLRWNRAAAIFLVAAVFAALHAGNSAVTALALVNVFLGGLLLGLAWERSRTLWFPIGIHLAWNLVSGPVLGHEVSGYLPIPSLFREQGSGPGWLTGGEFGIEGSVWMTAFEVVGVGLLARRRDDAEG